MPKRPTRPTTPRPTPTPVPQPAPVADSDDALLFPEIAHLKKRQFLTEFALCGSRQLAAEKVGMARRNHLYWLVKDAAYEQAFRQAQTMAADGFEEEIHRRGVQGIDRAVWHQGVKVGEERVYSDTLLIFQAKGAMPWKYRDNATIEHTMSPALEALSRQWEMARQGPRPRQNAAPQDSIDAEFEPSPAPGERGREPHARSVAEIFAAIDASNNLEPMEDADEDDFRATPDSSRSTAGGADLTELAAVATSTALARRRLMAYANRFDDEDRVNPSVLFPKHEDFNDNARLMHQTRSRAQALADPAMERAIQQEAANPEEAAELRRVIEVYGRRRRIRPEDIRDVAEAMRGGAPDLPRLG